MINMFAEVVCELCNKKITIAEREAQECYRGSSNESLNKTKVVNFLRQEGWSVRYKEGKTTTICYWCKQK